MRQLPHGAELRFVIGGEGREEALMQSVVYRHASALEAMSAGTEQNFVAHGWTLSD